ncbi:AI-2E family transporter [Portibacter lacus]|uniref:AI-2E family transporter n=1 Tax=Portibacter lacus TaxID=1099794 RepID=A0AA37SL40_9BACT|nr:AI-2E family transporter [Portibacter lacus]GLR15902.1 AI-2E family transporter [Portibacter lacus]
MKRQKTAAAFIIVAISALFTIYAKNFLVPLILSIVLWYIINALNSLLRAAPFVKNYIHKGVTISLSAVFVLLILFSIGSLITQNINEMIINAPSYRLNFERQIGKIAEAIGYSQATDIKTLTTEFDIDNFLRGLLNSTSKVASQFLLILLYTLFLLLEQSTFLKKIIALRMDKEPRDKLYGLLDGINNGVRTYIGVKFIASIATGIFSYIVIKAVGLEFALFWAFIIFLFNFIPTIGSIVATSFPTIFALIQFETLTPFFIVLIGVGVIQIIIGGILEPKFYGDSLNISPFVIVLSLVMWGMLWGVVGMLLCVPITVILIKIFAQFDNTRPIAIMLSRNGNIGAVTRKRGTKQSLRN